MFVCKADLPTSNLALVFVFIWFQSLIDQLFLLALCGLLVSYHKDCEEYAK